MTPSIIKAVTGLNGATGGRDPKSAFKTDFNMTILGSMMYEH
jgi:hypothetical protein